LFIIFFLKKLNFLALPHTQSPQKQDEEDLLPNRKENAGLFAEEKKHTHTHIHTQLYLVSNSLTHLHVASSESHK
jgi:hypothetical protein